MVENQHWSKEGEFLKAALAGTTDALRIASLEAALTTAQAEADALRAEIARLREVICSTRWTIENQPVAKALCQAVVHCSLGPSDDEGTLTLYDIIPDVWCVPDRTTATNEIAENIAFSALDAWLTHARQALGDGQ